MAQIISFASALILIHWVSKTDVGIVAIGTLLATIGTMFTDSGMRAALIQRPDRVQEAANTALIATATGGLIFAILALAAAPIIGRFVDHGDTVTQVAYASAGLLIIHAATIVPDALMQREFAFVRRLFVDPSIALTYAIVAISLCANGWGVWGLLLGTYASQVVALCLIWGLAKWRPQPGLASLSLWREMAGFGRHVLAGSIAGRVRDALETLIVNIGLSTAAGGIFRYGRRFSMLPAMATIDVGSYVLFPAFSRMSDDPARLRAAVLRALRWVWLLSIMTSAALVALGEPVAWFLLHKEEWREAGTALMGLAGFGAGEALIAVCVEACKSAGESSMLSRLGLVAIVLSGGLMLALLPFGIVGISIAVSVGALATGIVALRFASRILQIPWMDLLKEILPPVVAAAPAGATAWALEHFVVDAAHADRVVAGLGLAGEASAGLAVFLMVLGIVAPDRLGDFRRAAGSISARIRHTRTAPAG